MLSDALIDGIRRTCGVTAAAQAIVQEAFAYDAWLWGCPGHHRLAKMAAAKALDEDKTKWGGDKMASGGESSWYYVGGVQPKYDLIMPTATGGSTKPEKPATGVPFPEPYQVGPFEYPKPYVSPVRASVFEPMA